MLKCLIYFVCIERIYLKTFNFTYCTQNFGEYLYYFSNPFMTDGLCAQECGSKYYDYSGSMGT